MAKGKRAQVPPPSQRSSAPNSPRPASLSPPPPSAAPCQRAGVAAGVRLAAVGSEARVFTPATTARIKTMQTPAGLSHAPEKPSADRVPPPFALGLIMVGLLYRR